jgi:hypothetical protein
MLNIRMAAARFGGPVSYPVYQAGPAAVAAIMPIRNALHTLRAISKLLVLSYVVDWIFIMCVSCTHVIQPIHTDLLAAGLPL